MCDCDRKIATRDSRAYCELDSGEKKKNLRNYGHTWIYMEAYKRTHACEGLLGKLNFYSVVTCDKPLSLQVPHPFMPPFPFQGPSPRRPCTLRPPLLGSLSGLGLCGENRPPRPHSRVLNSTTRIRAIEFQSWNGPPSSSPTRTLQRNPVRRHPDR